MPFGPFYPVKDKRSGKTYEMPWDDMTRKPTEDDVRNFVYEQEERSSGLGGLWNKLNEPLTDIFSRGAKSIAEPLYQYGEYADLTPEQTVGARRNPLRHAARYGGALLESLGMVGDQALTSPAGLATLAGTGGAGLAARQGLTRTASALPNLARAAGAGQVAHGAYGVNKAFEEGSPRAAVAPAIEAAFGLAGVGTRTPRVKTPTAAPKPKIGDIIDAEFSYNAEPLSEGLATRPSGSVVRRTPSRPAPLGLPDISPDAPIVPSGPAGLPPGPTGRGLPPKSTAGPFFGGRRGVSTDIEDVIDIAPIAETPAEAAHFSMIPERYKPRSTTSNKGPKGPYEYVPDTAEKGYYPPGPESYGRPRPRKEQTQFHKRPAETAAESRARADAARLDKAVSDRRYEELKSKFGGRTPTTKVGEQPTGSKAWQRLQDLLSEEKGELDITALADAFQRGKKRVKDAFQSEKGQEIFGKAITKDPSEIPLKGAWQSGWGYLEEAGKPGQQLKRLLERSRLDFERLAAQNKLAELPGGKGKIGGFIYQQHKDEIKDLINQIPDEAQRAKVKDIVEVQLGQKQPQLSPWKPSTEFAKKMEAASKLSQFAIQNSVTLANNFMRGNVGATFEALMETVTNSKAAMETARKSGALHPLYSEILREISTSPKKDKITDVINKAFGIEWSEGKMRTMSALTGRSTAKQIFEQLKKNPGNARARTRLDDLVLEDVDKLLKQKSLTEDQLDRAAARMAEVTQGRAESIDLPPMWSGHPLADLATQFKRYGFAQTRNIKEALKKDPIRASAALLTALPAMGEVAGDLKAVVKGTAKGVFSDEEVMEAIQDELKGRGTGMQRYMNDLEQAWAFGLFKDIWNAMGRGPRGLTEYAAGPTGADISKIGSGIFTGIEEGRWEPLQREAVRPLPYGIGPALAEDIEGSYVGRQQRRGRESRSRSRRRY